MSEAIKSRDQVAPDEAADERALGELEILEIVEDARAFVERAKADSLGVLSPDSRRMMEAASNLTLYKRSLAEQSTRVPALVERIFAEQAECAKRARESALAMLASLPMQVAERHTVLASPGIRSLSALEQRVESSQFRFDPAFRQSAQALAAQVSHDLLGITDAAKAANAFALASSVGQTFSSPDNFALTSPALASKRIAEQSLHYYRQSPGALNARPRTALQTALQQFESLQFDRVSELARIAASAASVYGNVDVSRLQQALVGGYGRKVRDLAAPSRQPELVGSRHFLAFVVDWIVTSTRHFPLDQKTIVEMVFALCVALMAAECSSRDSDRIVESVSRLEKAIETRSQDLVAVPDKKTSSDRRVVTERLNLRAEPSQASAVLTVISPNQVVEVLREEGAWCYVQYEDHIEQLPRTGWAHQDYLEALRP